MPLTYETPVAVAATGKSWDTISIFCYEVYFATPVSAPGLNITVTLQRHEGDAIVDDATLSNTFEGQDVIDTQAASATGMQALLAQQTDPALAYYTATRDALYARVRVWLGLP